MYLTRGSQSTDKDQAHQVDRVVAIERALASCAVRCLPDQVEIIGLTPELDGLVSPITSLVINTVKRDLQNLVTPLLREMLEAHVRQNLEKTHDA